MKESLTEVVPSISIKLLTHELFIAQPTDDIPRNKLVEKLARGLQAYV